jgi:hypothetical protein
MAKILTFKITKRTILRLAQAKGKNGRYVKGPKGGYNALVVHQFFAAAF